jgi:hypothetical protein
MNTIKIVGIALFVLIFAACNKEPQTPYDEVKDKSVGHITAYVDGKQWTSNFADITSNKKDGRYNLGGSLYINGIVRQSISLINISISNPKRQLLYSTFNENGYSDTRADSCIGSFDLSDHDVGEASFEVLEKTLTENYVQIENYNSSTKTVKGNFQMTVFTKEEPTQGFSDTLRITDGHFELTIKD